MLGIEVAAAVVLALGAGLLARSLWLLNAVDLGFDTQKVLAMTVRLPADRYADAAARLRFFDQMDERVRTLPGVAASAFANQLPMRGGWGGDLQVLGLAGTIDGEADMQIVSPEYFDTLGIPITRGRPLTDADRDGTPLVAVVSQTFVSRWAEGRDPVGLQFRRDPSSPLVTVVGVVGEVRRDGKFGDVVPQVYFSARQSQLARVELAAFAVRAAGDPAMLVDPIRQVVAALDADLTITNVRTLDEILSASVATRRFNSWLLFAFAMLAVTLAMVGVYGVVSHVVTQRTREIGIRIAMGAARRHVIGLVMRGSLAWAATGMLVGIGLALALSRLLTSMLFETSPTDPVTFAAVSALLMSIAVVASYVPARRAAISDPLAALRGE
jgi:putative ABC transport system permease protein